MVKTHDAATGPDEVHYRMLKVFHQNHFRLYILNDIWENGKFPESWELVSLLRKRPCRTKQLADRWIAESFGSVRFGDTDTEFEREVFFYYFSNIPLFLFVKLPDFRSRSLGPAISHCWSLFSPKLRV